MDFLDEEPSFETERPDPVARRRQTRPSRGGPPNRQLLIRRGMALGLGLLVLILLALAVRGCLNARQERAMKDYVRDVSAIVNETSQTSSAFFERLADRGTLSVTEFVDEVNADRSAVDTYLTRVRALDPPDDMATAQTALEFTYEMRAQGMNTIAEQLRTALGDQGREKAIQNIASQMSVLYSSDFLYSMMVQSRLQDVLEAKGITGSEVPASQFVPEGTLWLSDSQIDSALGGSGTVGEADDNLTHGSGLIGSSINGTDLLADGTTVITAEGTPEISVQFQNQGDADESDVVITVTVGDAAPLTKTVPSIASGATETVTIPLTPTPTGPTTIEVEVKAVPGEQALENNSASYSVDFG